MTTRRTHRSTRGWRSLPVEDWPPKHRAAWERANHRENPVRRGGHAASLAPATRQIMRGLYGQVLWWLQASGKLDPQGDPVTQITREVMAEFVAARRQAVSDNTTYGNLRTLTMMMNCIAPDQSWKWIWRLSGAPRKWEPRAARRSPTIFPAGMLMHRLMTAMQTAIEVPVEELPTGRIRNLLLVAIGVVSGLRLRNLAAMRLGHSVVRRTEGWEIIFDRAEVKNGEAILCRLPMLTPFIERYLTIDRPWLLDNKGIATDAFWVSSWGRALSSHTIHCVFGRIGTEMLGYPINAHSVRHTEAIRIITNDPTSVELASLALAHADVSTVSEYYDKSGSDGAQLAWQKLVAGFVRPGRQ